MHEFGWQVKSLNSEFLSLICLFDLSAADHISFVLFVCPKNLPNQPLSVLLEDFSILSLRPCLIDWVYGLRLCLSLNVFLKINCFPSKPDSAEYTVRMSRVWPVISWRNAAATSPAWTGWWEECRNWGLVNAGRQVTLNTPSMYHNFFLQKKPFSLFTMLLTSDVSRYGFFIYQMRSSYLMWIALCDVIVW